MGGTGIGAGAPTVCTMTIRVVGRRALDNAPFPSGTRSASNSFRNVEFEDDAPGFVDSVDGNAMRRMCKDSKVETYQVKRVGNLILKYHRGEQDVD